MEILNYTGQAVGFTDSSGKPLKVLAPQGRAHFDAIEANQIKRIDGVAIFQLKKGKVKGLPNPDWNHEKLYIVPKEIAEYSKNTRFDLLVVEDGFNWEGATFYKKLVQISA